MNITEQELTDLRVEQELYLDRRVTVRRAYAVSQDDISPHNAAEDVPCSIKPGFGFYRQVADQFKVVNPHIITFKWNEDIKLGDELIITDDGPDGLFAVRDISDQTSYITALRVLADRLQ